MGRGARVILITAVLLFHAGAACAKLADPSGVYAFFKDARFGMYADYQYYGKYFNERDINKYNGNNTIDPDTGEEKKFSDEIETFQWHQLKLYPKIVFNSKLELHMRLDMGDYIFSEDLKNRIEFVMADGVTKVKEDREKIELKNLALEMVTPVGLFLVGRFDGGKHGIIYGIQLPNLPTWTFAFAWLKKNEGKVDYYSKAESYQDKDDQNETALVTIYDDAEGFSSRQWIEARIARGESQSAKNTRIWLPQWELEYQKRNLHFWSYIGAGWGTVAELSSMALADDINTLSKTAQLLASLSDAIYFPDLVAEDVEIPFTIGGAAFVSYRLGQLEPGVGLLTSFGRGAENWYEVNGIMWDRLDRKGYPRDGRFKTLLTKEVEDMYYATTSTIGSLYTFDIDNIYARNLTAVHMRAWYDFSEKLEMFNQLTGSWRTSTEFYKKNYWEQFPLRYALNNQTATSAPFVFLLEDVDYYLDSVDPFIGWEFNGHLTYHLFDGLDVSLLYAYFKSGNFYKQVLEPKDYLVQWVNVQTQEAIGNPEIVKGPYTFADDFQLADAWSLQIKVDFRFEI